MIQSEGSLLELKEHVFNSIKRQASAKKIRQHDFPIFLYRLFTGRLFNFSMFEEFFSKDLTKAKKNINLELYPIFGTQIDALENYIQHLKEAGIDPSQSKKTILKSNRSKKYSIAEQLKNDLISFEAKNEIDRKADAKVTIAAIEVLIKENEEATGSHYLHTKGKLDKILKNVKDEIDFSINKNYTEKLKNIHLKDLEKKILKEAMVSGSGHLFRDEMVELTDFIERCVDHWRMHQKSFHSVNETTVFYPEKYIRSAKKLRTLLLNSQDLSDNKREILKSRIMAEIAWMGAKTNEYGDSSGKGLLQILEKIKVKIDSPKKLRP